MRRLVVALAGAAAIAAGCGSEEGSSRKLSRGPPPSRGSTSVSPREALRARREAGPVPGPRATVVEVLPPGNRSAAEAEAATDGERPPARVLAQNKQLRRELDHLRALEAEQRRVTLALSGDAGAFFDAPLRLGAGGLAWPVPGSVVSPFGQRWGRLHAGVDIAAPAGTVIRASQDGGVVLAAPTGGYGNYVCVEHTTELTTCYAHLSRFLTRRGALVRQGEPIGLVGCTGHCFGDHLHFETRVRGRPVDPLSYL